MNLSKRKGSEWFDSISASSILAGMSLSDSSFIDNDSCDKKPLSFLDQIGVQFSTEGLQAMIDASLEDTDNNVQGIVDNKSKGDLMKAPMQAVSFKR